MKRITAENKRTGDIVDFTLEQWRNLENTGHSRYWKIIDTSALVPEKINIVSFSEEKPEIDYRQKLINEKIPFNKSIKNPEKLKKIYEDYHKL